MDYQLPEFIKKLPRANIPLEGVTGYLLPSKHGQAVFFEIEPIGEIPEHSHGAQWGIVLAGSMALKIEGNEKNLKSGDSYYIPAGAAHSAKILSKSVVLDFFADPDRYQAME
ncbi:MAG: cupin domain-containing protein [candidate division Zixibacteria bacterium]|nr:cupin domain-containing protein [candidate division Zixibacteria bacterium]